MNPFAMITGASRGIGQATAELFAAKGYDLSLICHHSYAALENLQKHLEEKYSIQCDIFCGDVSNYSDVKLWFENRKKVDVLINNAGMSYMGLLSLMTIEEWNQIIDTNLSSCFYTSKCAIPLMLKEKKGKIINVSSIWGNVGGSTEVAYSASKGGINAFTKALAKELAPSNIQVNAAAFGVIDTDMNRLDLTEEELNVLTEEIPMGRLGTKEEAAKLIYQLATAPEYLTGQIVTMDGGFC